MHNFSDNQEYNRHDVLVKVDEIINIAQFLDAKEALYNQTQNKIKSSKKTINDLQFKLDNYLLGYKSQFADFNNQEDIDLYAEEMGCTKYIKEMSEKIKIAKDNLESEEKKLPGMGHDLMESINDQDIIISENLFSLLSQLTAISNIADLKEIKEDTLNMFNGKNGKSIQIMHNTLENIFNEFSNDLIQPKFANVKKISFSDAALEAIKDFASKITTPLYTSLVAAKDNIVEYLSR